MRRLALPFFLALLILTPPAAGEKEADGIIDLVARILRSDEPPDLGFPEAQWKVLSEEERKEVAAKLLACAGREARSALRVSAEPEAPLRLSLMNRVRYLQDHDVSISRGGATDVVPIYGTVAEGLLTDLTPELLAAEGVLTVDLKATLAKLIRPIPTFCTTTSGPPLIIELPEVAISELGGSVRLPVGGMAVFSAGKLYGREDMPQSLHILLEATSGGRRSGAEVLGPR